MRTACGGNADFIKTCVERTEKDLIRLRKDLARVEAEEQEARKQEAETKKPWKWPLEEDEYSRYGRQLILPGVGVEGKHSGTVE